MGQGSSRLDLGTCHSPQPLSPDTQSQCHVSGRGLPKPEVSFLSDLEYESIQLAFTECLLYAEQ